MSRSTQTNVWKGLKQPRKGWALVRLGVLVVFSFQVVLPALLGTTVEAQPPAFSKAFSPITVGPGSVSTLVFTITNTDESPVSDLAFVDTLLSGLVVADPANAASTCLGASGVLAAPAGGDTISLTDGSLGAGASCTVVVDVINDGTPGELLNTSGDLTSSAGNSGTASATLQVVDTRPGFSKAFAPTSVSLGGRSTLTFTIDNSLNESQAVFLTFADNLPPGLVVAGPPNVSNTCADGLYTGGIVTAVPGSGVISLGSGGGYDVAAVGAGAVCTVAVDVVAVGVGSLGNSSGELTSYTGGTTVSSGKANASLDVTVTDLFLIKQFTDDPVPPGGIVTLEFTILNRDRGNPATDISFTDDLGAVLSGLTGIGLPIDNVCGTGSQLSGASVLTLSGGNLPPEGSCTFSVPVQVPGGAATDVYVNTTGAITGVVDGSPVVGNVATDVLFVAPVPILTKTFSEDAIAAGGTVDVTFEILNTSSTSAATGLAFTDDLMAFMPGVGVSNLPAGGFCGPGSSLIHNLGLDISVLVMSGGSLAAGDSCTFGVTLQVPADTPNGTYINTTSELAALIEDTPTLGEPATDDLVVVGSPSLSKSFTNDPVKPGDTVELEFTLFLHQNAPGDATDITFTDDLDAALAGLTATGLPISDICGTGSQLDGAGLLSFTGGSLAPGASCTFSVTLQVPATATHGDHTNTTSVVSASVAGAPTTGRAASADLRVRELTLTKSFIDDPVYPGDTVTLEFTLENSNQALGATGISFADNLDAMLPGTTAPGLPLGDVCGAGSLLSGVGPILNLSGGSLGPGGSCTFGVELLVPAGASAGQYGNTTSFVSAQLGGSPISTEPATDSLIVFTLDPPLFSKSFAPAEIYEGAISTLSFTIDNRFSPSAATGLSFTDNLPGGLEIASPPNASTTCSGGSLTAVAGTGVVSYNGGSVAAGTSCTVQVDVTSSVADTYLNTTGSLTSSLGDSGTASATLTVLRPPPGTIIVEKQADPDGAPDSFSFGGDAAGTIKDGEQIVVSELPPGTYTSQEIVPAGWSLTSIVCDDDNSSGDLDTATATFQLEPAETVKCTFTNTEHAGIGDYVWQDSNGDGLQDVGEPGIEGVGINLYQCGETAPISSTSSDDQGFYTFGDLQPGDYYLEFTLPANYTFSPQDQGADDCMDSDADPTTGQTACTTLVPGEYDTCWDAGMLLQADLAITKLLERGLFTITYTIVVYNLGPGDADGAVVSDTFASELLNPTWSCEAAAGASCTASGSGDILDTLANFPAGGVVTYTVMADLDVVQEASNTAEVIPPAGAPDPDLDNNRATVHTIYRVLLTWITKNYWSQPLGQHWDE